MSQSVLTEPISMEKEASKATPGPLPKKSSKAFNSLQIAQAQFDKVADYLGLDAATKDLLRYPLREFQFAIPVRMDDGIVKIFRGFRVQHNDARGPGKGGIRFHPQETIDTVRALSCWDQADQCAYTYRKSEGINLSQLLAITDHFGGISKAKAKELGYEVFPGEAWIEQDVDILIPAAMENQITGDNVGRIGYAHNITNRVSFSTL
jgi:glutamate dehydrogenase/leucine dehydrogenase